MARSTAVHYARLYLFYCIRMPKKCNLFCEENILMFMELPVRRGYKVDVCEVPGRVWTIFMGKSQSKAREGVLRRIFKKVQKGAWVQWK